MFFIQVGNPFFDFSTATQPLEPSDVMGLISGAFYNQEYYPTEKLMIFWKGIFLSLDFDEHGFIWDLPYVLDLIINKNHQGKASIKFTDQNGINLILELECFETEIKLGIHCIHYTSNSDVQKLLRSYNNHKLTMLRNDFLAEWKMVLKKYLDLFEEAIQKYDIRLENPDSYDELKALFNAIPYYGYLYKHLNAAS